jgi:hypothetical protein
LPVVAGQRLPAWGLSFLSISSSKRHCGSGDKGSTLIDYRSTDGSKGKTGCGQRLRGLSSAERGPAQSDQRENCERRLKSEKFKSENHE